MNRNSCHFCKKVFPGDELYGHLTNCQHILQACPRNCGSYVRRIDLDGHIRKCRNSIQRHSYNADELDQYASVAKYATITKKPTSHAKVDDCVKNVNELSENHKKTMTIYQAYINKMQADIETLRKQNKIVVDWRNNVQTQLDQVKSDFSKRFENLKEVSDIHMHNINEIIVDIVNFKSFTINQQQIYKSEVIQMKETYEKLKIEMEKVNSRNEEENKFMVHLANDQTRKIDDILRENEGFEKRLLDLNTKLKDMTLELHAVSKFYVKEQSQLEKQTKDIDHLKESMAQCNLDVEMAEESLSSLQGFSTTGRIIWKINEFQLKLENARKNDKTMVKSPIFYTHDYGYKIRMVFFLNGLKKWKGRYILACMQVLKGDYDDLLKWPCRIEANVVLKDCSGIDENKDYVRYVTAKREYAGDEAEEPQESSTQYIFIPHSVVLKEDYLKNNAIYIEILVKKYS